MFHITRDEWIHGMKALKYNPLLLDSINNQGRHIIKNERYITILGEIYLTILCRRNFRGNLSLDICILERKRNAKSRRLGRTPPLQFTVNL